MLTIEFLRSFKLSGFALFDFAVSFLGMYVLAPLLSWFFLKLKLQISRKSWLLLTTPISVFAHLLVGADTPLVQDFTSLQRGFLIKVIVVLLLYLGVKEIKVLKK